MPSQLVLFDIDNTLIASNGASGSTHAAAFTALTGRQVTERVPVDGRTDRLILRDLFAAHRVPWTADLQASAERALTVALSEMVPPFSQVRSLLPGTRGVLATLAPEPAVAVWVLTGNIRANAVAKQEAFGLLECVDLDVAATGSDAEIRAELPDIARRRAAAKHGV